jgi:hypothetical protein
MALLLAITGLKGGEGEGRMAIEAAEPLNLRGIAPAMEVSREFEVCTTPPGRFAF